ncbi:bifunctional diguanylate cyclase/phosphodiesterase [Azorhizobium oxalatiphilum]|uniref:Bifunctional diguanylate cyclase/phosphodiesterase n=1 Tax=Azorhizobium oxalatiphilum TaxID=980631 RepID=A0A917FI60_9HYPH|nr:EAL domain-containing protein [Azorhizobium oxalatiphilum]GGF83319.1 bifunctional diguanylate cyclase/phosphodiesterase [Azorhizobium oxalatiphilum]
MGTGTADEVLGLLAELTGAANGAQDLSCLTPGLLGRLAGVFDLQRVSLFKVRDSGGPGVSTVCCVDWTLPGRASLLSGQHPPAHGGGDPILAEWSARRRRGEIVKGLACDFEGYMGGFMRTYGVVNFLTVAVMVNGRWWGHLCGDSADEARVWTLADQRAFQCIAEILSGVIARSGGEQMISEASRRGMLDSAIDAVVIADEAGAIIEFNQAAEIVFGFARADILGRPVTDTILPPQPFASQMEGGGWPPVPADRGLAKRTIEAEARRADASTFPVEVTVSEISSEGRRLFAAHIRDISDRLAARRELERIAYFDEATGLPNRAGLLRLCARRSRLPTGAVVIQMRDLGVLAASLGDEWAKPMVWETANIMRALLPPEADVARTGESEFAVVLWREGDATELAGRLRQRLNTAVVMSARRRFYLRAGIGVVERSGPIADILRDADMASRGSPDGTASLFEDAIRASHQRRLELETALRDAVQHRRSELMLHYQPVVAIATGRIAGFEALARWRPRGLDDVPPSVFVPLAEASGLADSLGDWVIDAAMTDCAAWNASRREEGQETQNVSINLSATQLANPDLAQRIGTRLERHGLKGQQICFELTESAILSQPDLAIRTLHSLRGLGCATAIDDFGTGYSSFSYLQRLPMDVLKIDRSFIQDLVHNERTREIVRVMVGLAHGLGMTVVGEGVETRETLPVLARLGCDYGQGFLLGRPQARATMDTQPSQVAQF